MIGMMSVFYGADVLPTQAALKEQRYHINELTQTLERFKQSTIRASSTETTDNTLSNWNSVFAFANQVGLVLQTVRSDGKKLLNLINVERVHVIAGGNFLQFMTFLLLLQQQGNALIMLDVDYQLPDYYQGILRMDLLFWPQESQQPVMDAAIFASDEQDPFCFSHMRLELSND